MPGGLPALWHFLPWVHLGNLVRYRPSSSGEQPPLPPKAESNKKVEGKLPLFSEAEHLLGAKFSPDLCCRFCQGSWPKTQEGKVALEETRKSSRRGVRGTNRHTL